MAEPEDFPFVDSVPAETDLDGTLTTLTLTIRERLIVANALVITTAISTKLAPGVEKQHMALWERVMEGVPS